MTIEDMAIKEMIENAARQIIRDAQSKYDNLPDMAEGDAIHLMRDITEAAKMEERKRITDALPDYLPPNYTNAVDNSFCAGFNECLDKVRSIINPQI